MLYGILADSLANRRASLFYRFPEHIYPLPATLSIITTTVQRMSVNFGEGDCIYTKTAYIRF